MLSKVQFEYILRLFPCDSYASKIKNELIKEHTILANNNKLILLSDLLDELYIIIYATYGVTKKQLRSKHRQRDVVYIRYVIMVILREYRYTLHQIGDILGYDHSSVCHALRIHDNMMRYNDYASYYNTIKNLLITKIEISCTEN